MDNETLHNVALFYADQKHWRVLPVNPGSKVPALADWPRVATTDHDTVDQWWSNGYAGFGIGVATGPGSDIVVIDIDDNGQDKHGLSTWADLVHELGPPPSTPTLMTPSGGLHYYYRWPGFNPDQHVLGPDIDVQGEGRYVLTAPSTHPNGGTYEWEVAFRPSIMEANDFGDVWLKRLGVERAAPMATGADEVEKFGPCGAVLLAADFKVHHVDGDGKVHMSRPGKDPKLGSSATVYPFPDHHAVIWSSSVPGVETKKPYYSRELAALFGVVLPDDGLGPWIMDEVPAGHHLSLVAASTVTMRETKWLWHGRIPLGGAALLVGMEGLGKSTIAIDVAAQATEGVLDGDLEGEPVDVIYVSAEDSEETTIVPRLAAARANLDRVHFIRIDGEQGGLSIPGDLVELTAEMKAHGARLLVLDPLSVHIGDDKTDSHRERDVRRALAPLAVAMQAIDAAAVGVMHWSKAPTMVALDRVLGSRAFTAAARAVLGVGEDPTDPALRILIMAKSNLGRGDTPALAFGIDTRWITGNDGTGALLETSGVRWEGERTGLHSSDLFRHADPGEGGERLEEARQWLLVELGGGPMDAKAVEAGRKVQGISKRTFERARSLEGVEATSWRDEQGRHAKWLLRLPGDDRQPTSGLRPVQTANADGDVDDEPGRQGVGDVDDEPGRQGTFSTVGDVDDGDVDDTPPELDS